MANKETVKEENTVTIDGNELKESELTDWSTKVFCKSDPGSKSQKDAITKTNGQKYSCY